VRSWVQSSAQKKKTWTTALHRGLTEKDKKVVEMNIKCHTSCLIRGMQVKTKTGCYYLPIRTTETQNVENVKCVKTRSTRNCPLFAGGIQNDTVTLEIDETVSYITTNTVTVLSSNHALSYLLK
jgi:hypothetical protein